MMVTIEQEGEVGFEIQQVHGSRSGLPYRARLEGTGLWYYGVTLRDAVTAAASKEKSEYEDALGDLWEADDDV